MLRVAVDQRVRTRGDQAALQLVPQCLDSRILLFQVVPRQLGRLAETGKAGDILSAGAPAMLLPPANEIRRKRRVTTHIPRPNPLGRMQLVAAQGQKVNLGLPQVDRHLADRLHRVVWKSAP